MIDIELLGSTRSLATASSTRPDARTRSGPPFRELRLIRPNGRRWCDPSRNGDGSHGPTFEPQDVVTHAPGFDVLRNHGANRGVDSFLQRGHNESLNMMSVCVRPQAPIVPRHGRQRPRWSRDWLLLATGGAQPTPARCPDAISWASSPAPSSPAYASYTAPRGMPRPSSRPRILGRSETVRSKVQRVSRNENFRDDTWTPF